MRLARRWELTGLKRTGGLLDVFLADYRLFRLDGDLRWIDTTLAQLDALAEEVRRDRRVVGTAVAR